MRSGDTGAIHPVLLVTYLFFAAPIALDLTLGEPNLSAFPGFAMARRDDDTRLAYLGYVAAIFPLLYIGARLGAKAPSIKLEHARGTLRIPRLVQASAYWFLYLPLLLVALSPNPAVYASYTNIHEDGANPSVATFHAFVAIAGQAAIVAAVVLLLSKPKISIALIINITVALAVVAWLNGKRATVAMILAGVIYALWQRGSLRGSRLLATGALGVLALGLFSTYYQDNVREETAIAADYDVFRIDYGRDNQTMMSIYAAQNPDTMRILPAAGHTLPLYFGQLVPSSVWPEKPMPYSQYFTSALFLSPPQLWGWGMTTSWFEEWISNIGLAGCVVAPSVLGMLCRIPDRATSAISRTAATVVLVMLVVLEVAAFAFLVPLAIALVTWDLLRRRAGAIRANRDHASSIASADLR